jgi:hypothetical protein
VIKDIFWLHKAPGFWIRAAARCIDYCLFYLVVTYLSLFLPFYIQELYYLIFAVVLPLIWVPFEAFCLARWATTPGKKLFGLQVRTHIGGKLPFWLCLKRASFCGIRPGVLKQKTIGIKGKIIGCVVMLISFFGACFHQELSDFSTGYNKQQTVEGWVDYTSEKGGFRVLFPTDPKEESKLIPLPEQNRVLNYNELKSLEHKKVSYSVSYMQIPKKWKLAGSSRILQGALEGIVEHTDGATLVSKQFSKHQSYRTLDFHVTQNGEEMEGRLIMVGNTLYRLTVTYPPSYSNQLQQQEFLNSFEVQS